MILSDGNIITEIASGHIGIDPFDPDMIQPASLDIRLGRDFRSVHSGENLIRPGVEGSYETVEVTTFDDGSVRLPPNEFMLGTTFETVRIPADRVAALNGKSSLARLGLIIHTTAGYIDPGFNGKITLELANLSRHPIELIPGMKIGQLVFFPTLDPASRPYGHPDLGSKYQGQNTTTGSAYYENYPDGNPTSS